MKNISEPQYNTSIGYNGLALAYMYIVQCIYCVDGGVHRAKM